MGFGQPANVGVAALRVHRVVTDNQSGMNNQTKFVYFPRVKHNPKSIPTNPFEPMDYKSTCQKSYLNRSFLLALLHRVLHFQSVTLSGRSVT